MTFNRNIIPNIEKHLNRGRPHLQIKKVCCKCNRGFSKRKGREKYAQVYVPSSTGNYVDSDRHICRKCYRQHLEENGKAA